MGVKTGRDKAHIVEREKKEPENKRNRKDKLTNRPYAVFKCNKIFYLHMIMIKRDDRYDLIKPMIAEGKILSFNDIFKYIPKTIVAKDLGKKVDRFNILMIHVEQFALEDLFILAGFFDLENREMLNLVMNDYEKSKQEIPRSIMSS